MLLTLKVGNTTIGAGVFQNDTLLADWTMSTRYDYTPDELGVELWSFLHASDIKADQIDGFFVNSVVPNLNWALSKASLKYFNQEAVYLDHTLNLIPLDVREPERVGADRIADCIAGYKLFGGPLLVIDFGTATTFNLISKEGAFLGGAIAPTMEIASESLVRSTAQLFKVELEPPTTVIGKDTVENIQAGVVFGFFDLIEGLIRRFQSEYAEEFKVIATGGRGGFFAHHIPTIEHYDDHLALKGLQIAWQEREKS